MSGDAWLTRCEFDPLLAFLILIPDQLPLTFPSLDVLHSPPWDNQSTLIGLHHRWYQRARAHTPRFLKDRPDLHSLWPAFDESAAYVNSESKIH
jgi:hypothetical protein